MTEAEWLAATDPTPMLEFLRGKASDRKLRLFAVACCRSVWVRLPISFKGSLSTIERFADGEATAEEFSVNVVHLAGSQEGAILRGLAYTQGCIWNTGHIEAVASVAFLCARLFVHSVPPPPRWDKDGQRITAKEERKQAVYLQELFGNPFRPVSADPVWLTSTVVALATGIYADRAFDRLPILADALQDAGCDDTDVLGHCRSEGPHVRGCWVVDLLTGRE